MTNPAIESLRLHVSGKISPENPPITEKPTLACLRLRADGAREAFQAECLKHWDNGEWGAYHAWDNGESVPETVTALHDAYITALHTFYGARDGDKGFLGGKGL